MIFRKVFYRKPPGQKNWSICREKLHFKIRHFFQKIPFQISDFQRNFYFKIMAFKTSKKTENYAVFPGTKWVRTFFFRCEFLIEIWFLNKNWTQKLSSGKNFFSRVWLFEKFSNIKSAGTKNSQYKTWHFGNFSFQNFIVQENFCFRIWLLFFWKFHFKLWFSMKKFATKSCLLKWVRKVNKLLFCAEQIESKPGFLDLMFLSKSDFSVKVEFKI